MESKNKNLFLTLFLVVVLMFSACEQDKINGIRETATVLLPSATNVPSETFSPNLSPTYILVPTLIRDQALKLLLQNIQTNRGCDLPCWWGIKPGVSTNFDVYQTFFPFMGIADKGYLTTTDSRSIDFVLPISEFEIYLTMYFRPAVTQGPIGMIEVQVQQMQGDKYTPYQDLFSHYSLQNILMVYGPPTQVWLDADIVKFEANAPTSFDTYLAYPEKGIYVRYITSADNVVSENKIQSCPTEAHMAMWLATPGDEELNQKLLTEMNPEWAYTHKTLLDAAKMTVNQFYETFKNTANPCLETPKSIWKP